MLPAAAAALLAALPAFVAGLTLDQPSTWNDSSFNTLTWSSVPTDPPTFSVDLFNNQSFPQGLNILDSVKTADGQIKFNLPGVPQGGNYTLVAHLVGSPTNVLYTTSTFKIVDSRTPNSTAETSTSSSVSGVTAPAGGATAPAPTFGGGVPQAPTSAPSFPGQNGSGDGSDTGAALGLRPAFALGALALVFML